MHDQKVLYFEKHSQELKDEIERRLKLFLAERKVSVTDVQYQVILKKLVTYKSGVVSGCGWGTEFLIDEVYSKKIGAMIDYFRSTMSDIKLTTDISQEVTEQIILDEQDNPHEKAQRFLCYQLEPNKTQQTKQKQK